MSERRPLFSKREPMFTWFRFIARCLGKECQHPHHLLTVRTASVFCAGCCMLVHRAYAAQAWRGRPA